MKLKVFCSLPMKDVPWPEIEYNLLCMKQQFTAVAESKYGFSPDDEFEFIDNLHSGGTPMKGILHEPVWYLHKALEKLADCDMALFHSDWGKANGCAVEHVVCARYGIPIYYCFKEGEDEKLGKVCYHPYHNDYYYKPRIESDISGRAEKDTNVVEALGAKWTWGGKERPKYVKMDPQGRYKKALKNAFDEAEWFFTDMMDTCYHRGMDDRQIADCHDMVNAIVDAAVLKYEWKKHILEGKDGEA